MNYDSMICDKGQDLLGWASDKTRILFLRTLQSVHKPWIHHE